MNFKFLTCSATLISENPTAKILTFTNNVLLEVVVNGSDLLLPPHPQ